MDLDQIRKLVVIAMFSDDVLLERLVLKGGNALGIVHKLTLRSSIDVDFSIEDDFEDLEDTKRRIFHALKDRFDSAGFLVFDETFEQKPSVLREGQSPRWGGYRVQFKLIEKRKAAQFAGDIEQQRRNASVVGDRQERKFTIDISKFEYCSGKQEVEIDAFTVYVYTPEMIVLEKLRAICQQMPEYAPRGKTGTSRARDFFDIHAVASSKGVDLEAAQNIALLRNIFAAKEVPLGLLEKIAGVRAFHESDWDAVRLTVTAPCEPFEFYFDFVVRLANRLHSLGKE